MSIEKIDSNLYYSRQAKRVCNHEEYWKASFKEDRGFYFWVRCNKNSNTYARKIWSKIRKNSYTLESLAREICKSKEYLSAKKVVGLRYWVIRNKDSNVYAKKLWDNCFMSEHEKLAIEICKTKDYERSTWKENVNLYSWILRYKSSNPYAREIWINITINRKNNEDLARKICKTKEYWRASFKEDINFYNWVIRHKESSVKAKEIWEHLDHRETVKV